MASCGFAYSAPLAAQSLEKEPIPTKAASKASLSEKFDWVNRKDLPAQTNLNLPPGCGGIYIDPKDNRESRQLLKLDPATLPLNIEANEASMRNNTKANLTGSVEVVHGARTIKAESLIYDKATDIGELEGKVVIRQPGSRINAERASINASDNSASFNNASFVLHEQHMRGEAESIEQSEEGTLILNGGMITSCEPGATGWAMRGGRIKIDPNTQQGVATHMRLEVADVPVFYIPYIRFPIGDQRQSGLLAPNISSSDRSGLDVSIPYYWNIAPNMDATITPRIMTGRGNMLELQGRHLSQFFESDANFAYLPNDEDSADDDLERSIREGEISEEEARPFRGEDRWIYGLEQRGGSGGLNGWYSRIDFTRASDVNYVRDFGSSFSANSRSFLDQSFTAGYRWEHWDTQVTARDYQLLLLDLDAPYRRLPEIDASGYYSWGKLSFSSYSQFVDFDVDEPTGLAGNTIITGSRIYSNASLDFRQESSFGFFNPGVELTGLAFQLEDSQLRESADDNPDFFAAGLHIDSGLFFEKNGERYTQTLEPRLFYNYREDVDQSSLNDITNDNQDVNFDTVERTFTYNQIFRDSRFSGFDRIDDANRLTTALTRRWIDPFDGSDLFRISVGQIFHFESRDVSLDGVTQDDDKSELAWEVSAALNRFTRIESSLVSDTSGDKIQRGTLGFFYEQSDFSTLFNINFSYLRDGFSTAEGLADIEQIDLNFIHDVSKQWNVFGKFNYDFAFSQELETFIGLEYNDCCYRFRTMWRRWLDSNVAEFSDDDDIRYDIGIFFEIQFKGLGETGKKIQSALTESIFGYDERARYHNNRNRR